MQSKNVYIKIALPIAIDQLFTYQLKSYQNESNLIGRRALVSFANRSLTGVIVDYDGNPSSDYVIKEVTELIDDEPIFDASVIKLCSWIAEYYMASLGETLKAALPQGMSPKTIIKANILPHIENDAFEAFFKNSPKRKELFDVLKNQNKAVSVGTLQKKLRTASVSQFLTKLEEFGLIEFKEVETKRVKAKKMKTVRFESQYFSDDEKYLELLKQAEKKSPQRLKLLEMLYEMSQSGIGKVLYKELLNYFSAPTINSLKKLNVISIELEEVDRNDFNKPVNSLARTNEFELKLTDEQAIATNAIVSAMNKEEFKTFLLHGVTGSGKTLVYIQTIHECLKKGKTALLLVPEISLTPQLIDRFEKVFSGEIAVIHSRMSDGDRYDAWRKARSNRARIVIGARSAIFAPLQNLGLIIVDEEHEASYKQESPNPRYNARDTAIVRASFESAVVVLGSATPSFESYYNAQIKRYELLQILSRADGAKMPQVKAIDTISAGKSGQILGTFSKEMLDQIISRIEKHEGIILFQNRRGFASFLECPDCAEVPTCKNCSVTLVYHKTSNQLRCHYCGYTAKAHRFCVRCGYPNMSEVGTGTQRIEDELNEFLLSNEIDASIERMDLDTTKLKGSHRAMLERFSEGRTDILLGTQMVAKGIDFERVTLVGVVNADIQLFLPDFRAGERTLQLLLQVSGRAGRSSSKSGEVLIQTAHPNNPAIIHALEDDYIGFYHKEIIYRKNALYPPYSRFCMIEFTSEDDNQLTTAVKHFIFGFPRSEKYIVLGPVLPTISKIRGRYRRLIIIKDIKEFDQNGNHIRSAIKKAVENYNKKKFAKVKFTVDIDTYQNV